MAGANSRSATRMRRHLSSDGTAVERGRGRFATLEFAPSSADVRLFRRPDLCLLPGQNLLSNGYRFALKTQAKDMAKRLALSDTPSGNARNAVR